ACSLPGLRPPSSAAISLGPTRATWSSGAPRASVTAALAVAVAAPQPRASKPASVTRSVLTLTENVIWSQHEPPPTVAVKLSRGRCPSPWGEVRWCSKASGSMSLLQRPKSELAQLDGLDGCRGAGQRIGPARGLGESDHLADVVAA